MNRLTVGDTESTKSFKRTIRQMMEVFLRFTHRYWFHEISNQDLAQSVFRRLRHHLGSAALYVEVRDEVVDMNSYLDSDSARRQANTVLRLTVVTILGLIGTIVTGFLGMNLIDETDAPLALRVFFFVTVLAATVAVSAVTIARSRRIADLLDTLSDESANWSERLQALKRLGK
jgi:Mg2+ and Co2+ transporter CorA